MACAGDAHACALAERHSNHIALMVLSVVLPVGLALITLLLRAVAGRPAGGLGWARLTGLAVLQGGGCPVVAIAVGVFTTELAGSPVVGAVASVVVYGALVAGWALLLHAAVNKRGLTPFIQPAP